MTPIMPADELLHNPLQLKSTTTTSCNEALRSRESAKIQQILRNPRKADGYSHLHISGLLYVIFNLPNTMGSEGTEAHHCLLETYVHYACRTTGGCKPFTTTNGLMGVALNLIEPSDRLVYPLLDCRHNDGSTMGMHRFLHQPTIILRPKDDKWEFRGVAYNQGLEKKGIDRSQAETFVIC